MIEMNAVTIESFVILAAVFLAALLLGSLLTRATMKVTLRSEVERARRDAVKRQRAVVGGQVSEQLAPYFPDFPFKPSEARFIGKPVDFIVFEGMDEKNIERVVFVEVKSGSGGLSNQERRLREAVEAGLVEWFLYRMEPE